MSDIRTEGRRSPSRAYRPALDGKLEDRLLLSAPLASPVPGNAARAAQAPPGQGCVPRERAPFALNAPRWNRQFRVIHAAASQTIRGGQAANVVSVDGTHYRIQLAYIDNTVQTAAADGAGGFYTQTTPTPSASIIQPSEYPQPIGTVRVYAMTGGKIGIIVDGSTPNTELTINPLPHPIRKGYAHSYAYGAAGRATCSTLARSRLIPVRSVHSSNHCRAS